MSITIEDISKRLGLSVSTVSKALNGYSDVADRTRLRVQEAARELGYHPNLAARSLRRGRSDKIGLLVNNPIEFLSDYIGDVMSGAALAAEQENQNLVLYTDQVDHPEELRRICRAREVDGLLLIYDPSAESVAVLEQENMPFIVFGRRSSHPNVSYIAPDNFAGAYELTQHLIDSGHTRIGFTTRPQLGCTNKDRFTGYCQALEDAGLPFDPALVIETRSGQRDGYRALSALLDVPNRPTALFAFYDLMAADALDAASDYELNVPSDMAIAGFDGLKIGDRTQPQLTTVVQPLAAMGREAVIMLKQRIGRDTIAPSRVTMPVHLMVRGSTGQTETLPV